MSPKRFRVRHDAAAATQMNAVERTESSAMQETAKKRKNANFTFRASAHAFCCCLPFRSSSAEPQANILRGNYVVATP